MQPKTITVVFLLFAVAGIFSLMSCAGTSQTPDVSPAEPVETEATSATIVTERQVPESQEPESQDMYIEVTDIYFDKGKASFNATAQATLQDKADWLMENPQARILLQGHTDEPGNAEYNLAFGLRRAGNVKSFLIRQGIDPARMTVVSFGRERPASTSDDENERAANRRVQFVIDTLH